MAAHACETPVGFWNKQKFPFESAPMYLGSPIYVCVCKANGSAKTFETWLRGVALGFWFKMFLHRKNVPGSLATLCGRHYIQCVFGLLNSSGLMKFMMCLPHMFLLGIWHGEMTMHAFSQVPKPHGILNGSAKYNGDVSTLLGGWSCFDPNISKSKSTLHLCNYGKLLGSS